MKIFEFIKCLCAKLFEIFSNIYFGAFVPENSDMKKILGYITFSRMIFYDKMTR